MLHRFASTFIVLFWVVMTVLLVRSELNPEGGALRDIPVEHVLKVLFLHEQPSELRIFNGSKVVGFFRLHPRTDRDTQRRLMDFNGSLQIHSTPEQRHRISWDGSLEISPKGEIASTEWAITVQDPGFMRLEMKAVSGEPTARIVLKSRDSVLEERDVPIGQAGFHNLMKQLGVQGDVVQMVQQQSATAKPEVKARIAKLKFHGEKTDTYLLTVEQDGRAYVEAHFSQLGQILHAKTPLGYTLRADD